MNKIRLEEVIESGDLKKFDASTHVVMLVDLLDDTFEASRHSYQLISNVQDKSLSLKRTYVDK